MNLPTAVSHSTSTSGFTQNFGTLPPIDPASEEGRRNALRTIARPLGSPPVTLQELLLNGTPAEKAAAQNLISFHGYSATEQAPVIIQGTAGNDRVTTSEDPATGNVTVDMNGNIIQLSAAEAKNLILDLGDGDDWVQHYGNTSIEAWGGKGNDDLKGDLAGDRLFGDEGDDILRGMAGDDILDGGTGQDILLGGVGVDTFINLDNDTTTQDPVDMSAGVNYRHPQPGVSSVSVGEPILSTAGQTYQVTANTTRGAISIKVIVEPGSIFYDNPAALQDFFSKIPPDQLTLLGRMEKGVTFNSSLAGGSGWSDGMTIGSGDHSQPYESYMNHMTGTMFHELGHSVQGTVFPDQDSSAASSFRSTWSTAVRKDYLANGGTSISWYAETNPWEDMAEFAKLYTATEGNPVERAKLQEKFPNRYQLYQSLLATALTPPSGPVPIG